MVRVKESSTFLSDGTIDLEKWLHNVSNKGYFQNLERIRNACSLANLAHDHATETGESCLQLGLSMADILADLDVDEETLAAAIVFESVHYAELTLEDIEEQLGKGVAKLVQGIEKMSAISVLEGLNRYSQNKHQLDNVRKMLLAMVDDVRVVLIKLAERLCILRTAVALPESIRMQIATEAMEIYAPLANRLGIGAIKWEMEDLAFRYLQPEDYKAIAKGLNAKRIDRDRYVNLIVGELNKQIPTIGIKHFSVYGRSKHIHSIYRKMQRKNVSLEEIYDATAVRILVDTIDESYQVLGLVHKLMEQIPNEYDDYIAQPKPNGYRSLHTAVIGPEGRVFEVQIRTYSMHELAEMGVAAHWKYKEGGKIKEESHERKIEWLREVLAWHREMATNRGIANTVETEFLEDRIYVFTPDGDILDLPKGVTPLDFAYHIHSEIGHRCRGAKVNGNIVQLTYCLKTGDCVEILTGKEAKPSRDWVNPHLHYLKTSRAKAKVMHWFKEQDYEKNCEEGHAILEKELKVLGIKSDKLQEVAETLHYRKTEDLLAAIGRSDVKISQVISRLAPLSPSDTPIKHFETSYIPSERVETDLRIEGIGNLLTHMARCCQPLPGDDVVGYVTLGHGVSVHRQDCSNILAATEIQRRRFLQVQWGNAVQESFDVTIMVKAFDRSGLINDITTLLSAEKILVQALNTQTNKMDNTIFVKLTVELDGLNTLSKLLTKMTQIPNVIEARRQV